MEVVAVSGYIYNCRESNPTLDSIATTVGLDSTRKNFTREEFVLDPSVPKVGDRVFCVPTRGPLVTSNIASLPPGGH